MHKGLLVAVVMSCAACSPEPSQDSTHNDAEVHEGSPIERSAQETVVAPNLQEIPARFHGSWAAPGDSCTRWAEMRLSVSSNSLEFYESAGELLDITANPDGSIDIHLAMSGEGETWEMHETLSLAADGQSLALSGDTMWADEPVVRQRCP